MDAFALSACFARSASTSASNDWPLSSASMLPFNRPSTSASVNVRSGPSGCCTWNVTLLPLTTPFSMGHCRSALGPTVPVSTLPFWVRLNSKSMD